MIKPHDIINAYNAIPHSLPESEMEETILYSLLSSDISPDDIERSESFIRETVQELYGTHEP